jgi:low affinity Fe/Cu permease
LALAEIMHDLFRKFAARVSSHVGSGWTLMLAVGILVGSGWYFRFSDAWKLNTSLTATLTALLLLFFLQKSQNHSDKATHLKLDELVRAIDGARDEIAAAEDHAEKDMDKLKRD